MTVHKPLLFGSLALAALVVAGTAVALASRTDGDGGGDAVTLDSTVIGSFDLAPTLNTNATVQGEPLPVVDVQTLDGDAVSTGDLLGQPLVVNLWFSTCEPCKKELPDFAEVHTEYGDRVRFVGIDTFAPSPAEERFARDRGVQYELLYDADGEFVVGAGITNFPHTLFVVPDGTIVAQAGQLDAAELRRLIEDELL